jgi:hypothetical protein
VPERNLHGYRQRTWAVAPGAGPSPSPLFSKQQRFLYVQYLPFLVSKALNNSISPKTGFRPAEMVLGHRTTQ